MAKTSAPTPTSESARRHHTGNLGRRKPKRAVLEDLRSGRAEMEARGQLDGRAVDLRPRSKHARNLEFEPVVHRPTSAS